MRYGFTSFCAALWLLGAAAGCTAPDETEGLADELDEALDPEPDYVDEPADTPPEPQ